MNKTHGLSKTSEYTVWAGMCNRCYSEANVSYALYGGRGIRVCKRWHNFLNFLKDMGPRPDGCSIDRIDNKKGYNPRNCRWATKEMQVLNRRATVLNKEKVQAIRAATEHPKALAAKYGVSETHIRNVLRRTTWKNV